MGGWSPWRPTDFSILQRREVPQGICFQGIAQNSYFPAGLLKWAGQIPYCHSSELVMELGWANSL